MGEVMIPTTPLAEPAIWIEVLSRLHHDVAARYRFIDVPITVGRAYDNDVIVDDPHVAAHRRLAPPVPPSRLHLVPTDEKS